MIHGRIYLITNAVNGKSYVGQTTVSLAARFRQHCLLAGKCRAVESAIRKYGVESFTIAELATADTQDELNGLEEMFVEALSTIAPGGYNLKGGGGAKGRTHPETKEIQRANGKKPERLAQLRTLHEDPAWRELMREQAVENWPKVAEKMLAGRMRPEVQERQAASVKAAYERPEVLEKIRAHLSEMKKRPEVLAKRREQMLRQWADPEQKAERSHNISAALLGHTKKIDYSDAALEHRRQIAARRWADPDYRALMLARHSDPDVVRKRGEAIRAGWARRRERLAAQAAAISETKQGEQL